MGCHQNMADPEFWNDQVIATYGQIISNDEHIQLMNQLLRDAVMGKAAMEKAKELEQKIEAMEQAPAEMPAAPAEAPAEMPAQPPQGVPVAYAIGALVLGILLGIGAMALRQKAGEEE